MLSSIVKNQADVKKLRYIYIIDVDNRGNKSKFYGIKLCHYVGQTDDIIRRLKQHILCLNSKFLSYNFRNAQKKLVYVDYIYGTEYEAIELEVKLKIMKRDKKIDLISSEQNKLIKYVPLKAIILKKYHKDEEQICIRM